MKKIHTLFFQQLFKPAALINSVFLILFASVINSGAYSSNINKANEAYEKIAAGYTNKANSLFAERQWNQSIVYYEKAKNIYKTTGNQAAYFSNVINISRSYREMGEYDKTKKILTDAEASARDKLKPEDITFAKIHSAQAYLYFYIKEFDNSAALAEKAIKLRKKINGGNDTALFYDYDLLGNYYYFTDIKKSFLCYNEALRLSLLRKNIITSETAGLINNMGLAYWQSGDFEKALACYEKALLIYSKAKDVLPASRAYIFAGKASYFIQAGSYKEALTLLNLAENLILKYDKNNSALLASVYVNKAYIYLKRSDFEKVISCENKISEMSVNAENKPYIFSAYYFIAKAYFGLTKYAKSTEYFKKYIESKNQNKSQEPTSLLYLAKSFEKINENTKADSVFRLALYLINEKYPDNFYYKSCALLNYASFCHNNGEKEKALGMYEKAYNLCDEKFGLKNLNTAICLNELGDYWLAEGDYSKALQNYHLSLRAQIKNFDAKNVFKNPPEKNITADIDLLNAMKGKANALLNIHKTNTNENDGLPPPALTASLASYELAIKIIERLKIYYNNSESAIALSEKENKTYDEAVEAAATLYSVTGSQKYFDKAFAFAEKSKAAMLLSIIRNTEALKFAGVPENIQALEKDLQTKTDQFKQLLYDENKAARPDKNKIAYWNESLDESKKQYDLLVMYLGKSFPDYYNIKYSSAVTCPDSVSKKLGENQALVEYVQTAGKIYSFVITNKTREIFTIKIDSSFSNITRKYLLSVNTPDSSKEISFREYISSATTLYNLLVKPFGKLIKNKNLIIIPDENLCTIPFGPLITKPVSDTVSDYRSLPYFINDNALSYSGSATLLFCRSESLNKTVNNLVAFAPDYKNSGSEYIPGSGLTRNILTPLPGAKEEVEKINTIIDGKVYSGADANINNFKNNSAGYGILHFAMHAIYNDENPMYSKLAFDPANGNNGLLNTCELFNMKFKARLTVLSSCKTAAGKLVKGEGVFCLARGFMYAGCPSLIMTLWNINDESGSALMTDFYRNLSAGKSKDEALQLSKINYIRNSEDLKAAPYFWAGYINYGDNCALFSEKKNTETAQAFIYPLVYFLMTGFIIFYLRKYFILRCQALQCETMTG